MSFSVSPGVLISEVDITTTVSTGVSTSTGAFAGNFQWGPVNERTLIGSEVELVDNFGKPTSDTYQDFFSIANFLSYSSAAWVVRIGDANNQVNLNSTSGSSAIRIDNNEDYFVKSKPVGTGSWIARYPGAKGNSLAVAACDSSVSFNSNVTITGNTVGTWSSNFSIVPSTSLAASINGGQNDELHILVIDEDGAFSGTRGTILESYAHLSKAKGAKAEDGTNNYYVDVINNSSKYVRVGGAFVLGANTSGTLSTTWTPTGSNVVSLSKGTDLDPLSSLTNEYIIGYSLFSNPEAVDVALIVSGAASTVVAQSVIDIATNRKDSIAFISPLWANVQPGQSISTITTAVTGFRNSLNRSSSYFVVDSGWKYQYDKYNDVYRWVPLNGDIAGLCARTDSSRDPWWSPAGFNRGNILNIIKLAWNPGQAERDLLYPANVNPVVSFPGEGTILYGDKTGLTKPSAFDRINVRRLFILLEKIIANSAKYSLFEFNDEFTRAQFKSMIEPLLRDIKSRRGVYDFQVICDGTNNTAQVIDANQFVGDIYIKPAKSVSVIKLNFVAVRTGVSFNEIIGKF